MLRRAVWWLTASGPRRILVAACAVILGLYCCNRDMGNQPDAPRGDGVYRPVLARGDGHMQYLMARSTALDGDWRFDNDLAQFGDPWRQRTTATGRKAIGHPIGPALIWTPLIWIAQGGAVIANALGAEIQLHGYTLWHQRLVFLSSALFACGAVLLGARLAQRLIDQRAASDGGGTTWAPAYAAAAVLLGTSVTYYATHMPSYVHAMDSFACAAFLAYWAHTAGRSDAKRWLVLGALLGVAALVRIQELAMAIVVVIEIAVATVRRHARAGEIARWWLGGALAAVVALIVLVPQFYEWHVVFGSATELPQGARYTRLDAPMIGELLFAARNGWFSTTPIAYLGVIGLLLVPRRARLVGAGLIAAVAIQVYLNSTILDWWGSAGFGQRRMCNVTLPLVVGLAALLWRSSALVRWLPVPVRHAIALAVLGPIVAWNLWRVGTLRGGRPASDSLIPTCCANIAPFARGSAEWVYQRIGNPLQFPANAWFALRHGVGLDRWDRTVGNYPFVPPLDALLDDRVLAQHRGVWRIGDPGLEPYLLHGWSGAVRRDRPMRWTTEPSATVLVPNLLPYGQRLTLWLAAAGADRATLRWNGDVVAEVSLTRDGAWTRVAFELPEIALHTNELTIESQPAVAGSPTDAQVTVPQPSGPVGVAVGDLELALLPKFAR